MNEVRRLHSGPSKRGRFLLSRRTFRTNVIIYVLTWGSLFLLLGAVLVSPETASSLWWVVLIAFFNTLSVGLSHRELMRLTIQQEAEFLDAARSTSGRASQLRTAHAEGEQASTKGAVSR